MYNNYKIYFKGGFVYDKQTIIRENARRHGTSTDFQSTQSTVIITKEKK